MSEWKPIETLDKSKPHYVLVHEDGAIRAFYWESSKQEWTSPDPPFAAVRTICANPTEWMELPERPPARTGGSL